MTELRHRPLFYALRRRIWELREELTLLDHYVACKAKPGACDAAVSSDFHLPGTWRDGFVARLQRLFVLVKDGAQVRGTIGVEFLIGRNPDVVFPVPGARQHGPLADIGRLTTTEGELERATQALRGTEEQARQALAETQTRLGEESTRRQQAEHKASATETEPQKLQEQLRELTHQQEHLTQERDTLNGRLTTIEGELERTTQELRGTEEQARHALDEFQQRLSEESTHRQQAEQQAASEKARFEQEARQRQETEQRAASLQAELEGLRQSLGVQGQQLQELAQGRATAAETGVELAKQRYKPEFGIDLTYGGRGGTDMDGRSRSDLFSVMLVMDLPLFHQNRQDRYAAASAAHAAASLFERDDLYRRMSSEAALHAATLQRQQERRHAAMATGATRNDFRAA